MKQQLMIKLLKLILRHFREKNKLGPFVVQSVNFKLKLNIFSSFGTPQTLLTSDVFVTVVWTTVIWTTVVWTTIVWKST